MVMADSILGNQNATTPIEGHRGYLPTAGGGDQSLSLPTLFPVDIWGEIFLWSLPAPDILNTPFNSSGSCRQTAPLLLCQVCRSWRRVAILLPELWCSLRVVITHEKARPTAELVSRWLARSGSLPLTLSLYQENEAIGNQLAAAQILNIYTNYVSRWKTIRLDLAGPQHHQLLGVLKSQAPLLEHFHMRTCRVGAENDLFKTFEQDVPMLSTLVVSFIPYFDSWRQELNTIPWNSLTSLSVDFVPSVKMALDILGECYSIEHCKFGIESNTALPSISHRTHEALRSLDLSIDCKDLSVFVSHTTLPALVDLTIRGNGPREPHTWPQDQINDLLKRSGARLRNLRLHNSWIREHQFIAFIEHPATQSVVELVVEDETDWTFAPCLSDIALKRLTFDEDSLTVLLPVLESLKILGIGCLWCVDWKAVVGMVLSRWKGYRGFSAMRLKSLRLSFPSWFVIHQEDLEMLRRLQQEGLELYCDAL